MNCEKRWKYCEIGNVKYKTEQSVPAKDWISWKTEWNIKKSVSLIFAKKYPHPFHKTGLNGEMQNVKGEINSHQKRIFIKNYHLPTVCELCKNVNLFQLFSWKIRKLWKNCEKGWIMLKCEMLNAKEWKVYSQLEILSVNFYIISDFTPNFQKLSVHIITSFTRTSDKICVSAWIGWSV